MKKHIRACLIILLLLLAGGCGGKPEASPTEPSAPPGSAPATSATEGTATTNVGAQSMSDDNTIDRAFARAAAERGIAQERDLVLTYLYALAWYDEYQSLDSDLASGWQRPQPEARDYWRGLQRGAYAYQYAAQNCDSRDASEMLLEIARYYKMLAADALERLREQGAADELATGEHELYEKLRATSLVPYMPGYDEYGLGAFEIMEALDSGHFPLIVFAELGDINLISAEPFGAILTVNGEQSLYPWPCFLGPRGVLPQLALSDYDGDGEGELAVILYTDSGTGVSVSELYIAELNEYKDYTEISGETIAELLYHRLSAEYDPAADAVTVRLDGQTVAVDVSQVDKENYRDFSGVDLTSIVYFSIEDDALKTHIAVGLHGFDYATPFEYVDLYADIVYSEPGRITLENCRIERSQ